MPNFYRRLVNDIFAHMAAIVHADLPNHPDLANQILDKLEVRIMTSFRQFDLPITSSESEGEEEPEDSEEDEETSSEDAVSVHASMLSSEIAQRVHPNVDFFEGHLHEVKERAELTIAKLEELKLFLLLLLKKKTPTTTSLCNNEEEEEEEEEDLEDEAKKTLKMEKEIRELSERMEKDFAFVDSAAETLKTIDAKVTEMEKEIWEQEKEMVKNTVGTKVEELRENFGKMLSGFAGFARSSSHAQSVDFEDAEKLRKEAMTTAEETKEETTTTTTTKATAEKVPREAHKEDNNGYYFGEDDSGDIQHSPEKEKTTTGLFGGFFSSSS